MSNLGEPGNPISDKDLLRYAACHRSHHLLTSIRIPGTGIAEAVRFFQNKRRKLFNVREKGVGMLFETGRRAGPQADHIEEMTPEELKEYIPFESGEKFGGWLRGTWLMKSIERKKKKRGEDDLDDEEEEGRRRFKPNPVYWKFAAEPFTLADKIAMAGTNYYNLLIKHGAPIMGLVDRERTFVFNDRHMKANFPEIRVPNKARARTSWSQKPELEGDYKIFVDHPSMFSFSGELIGKDRAGPGTSAIITLRLYGLSELIKQYPVTYLPKLYAPAGYWDYVESTKDKILKNLYFRHINLMTGEEEIATRTDSDLMELEEFVENHVSNVLAENYKPNKDSCSSCMYNTLGKDGSPVCHYRSKKHSPTVPIYYFDPKAFSIHRKDGEHNIVLNGMVETLNEARYGDKIQSSSVRHKVGKLRLDLEEEIASIKAMTHYSSEVYGITGKDKETFETRTLQEMDSLLKNLANSKGKTVIGRVDFKDFNHAGKTKVKDLLTELGYAGPEDGVLTKFYGKTQYPDSEFFT